MANGYICFYNRQKVEVHAETSFEAQEKAAKMFNLKPKHSYKISVLLAEKNGEQVTQLPLF